jgi:hypothetical protein
MAKKPIQRPTSHNRSIVRLPIRQEEYQEIIAQPNSFRQWLNAQFVTVKIPTHLLTDEYHTQRKGQKSYVATTAAEGCVLGSGRIISNRRQTAAVCRLTYIWNINIVIGRVICWTD